MRKLTIATMALLAISLNAEAGDNGVYLGAALSRSTIDTDSDFFGFRYQDDDTAYKFIGGIRPFDSLAIEVNYVDFGNIIFDDRAIDGFRSEFETKAIDASAVVFVGGPVVELFGKIGAVYWDADSVLQGGIGGLDLRNSDSGADITWGAGVQAQLASIALRLEYENFNISDTDKVELWSLGFTYTFL